MYYDDYRQCPADHQLHTIRPGDTLYHLALAYHTSVESIYAANPGIDPYYLRVGQRICIPVLPLSSNADYSEIIRAMQSDIDMLKAESSVQQTEEANYGTSQQTTRVANITAQGLQFDAVPVTFSGDFRGHYTQGHSYPYYLEAAMGGQRGITVKDNFGVWHSFGYRVPID